MTEGGKILKKECIDFIIIFSHYYSLHASAIDQAKEETKEKKKRVGKEKKVRKNGGRKKKYEKSEEGRENSFSSPLLLFLSYII